MTLLFVLLLLAVMIMILRKWNQRLQQQEHPQSTPSFTGPSINDTIPGLSDTAPARGRPLSPDEREALASIRHQEAMKRQHDSRMSAAAASAGFITGAAIAHHHQHDHESAVSQSSIGQTFEDENIDDAGDGYFEDPGEDIGTEYDGWDEYSDDCDSWDDDYEDM